MSIKMTTPESAGVGLPDVESLARLANAFFSALPGAGDAASVPAPERFAAPQSFVPSLPGLGLAQEATTLAPVHPPAAPTLPHALGLDLTPRVGGFVDPLDLPRWTWAFRVKPNCAACSRHACPRPASA